MLPTTVIIPTYNRAELLGHTLESLFRTDFPLDQLQVIVVDDGSTDSSFEVAKKYSDRCDVLYAFQPDRGYRLARARNLGLSLASGDICALVDCGVALSSGALSAFNRTFATTDAAMSLGYVYGFFADPGADLGIASEIAEGRADDAIEKLRASGDDLDPREKIFAICDDDLSRLRAPWLIAWGCNIAIDRRGLGKAARYDENFTSWGGEDLDIALALYLNGGQLSLTRDASSIHLPHGQSVEENKVSNLANKQYLHSKYQMEETLLVQSQSTGRLCERLGVRQDA